MHILKRIIRHIRKKRAFRLINGRLSGTAKFEKKRKLLLRAGYSIGEGAKIVGPIIITTNNLEIGKNCWIGAGFEALGNGSIKIEESCDIAPNVHIHTGGHEIGTHARRAGKGINSTTHIGSGCWVCAEVTIVNNVSIGDGCIILPGAVVTKTFGDDLMIGGIPAETIKKLP